MEIHHKRSTGLGFGVWGVGIKPGLAGDEPGLISKKAQIRFSLEHLAVLMERQVT